MVVAGTGHRPPKLGGYGNDVYQRLVVLAEKALREKLPSKVISGMALGWDQALAEAAARLSLPLIAAIPFVGQERLWPDESKKRYETLLQQATEKVVVCEGGYSPSKMQIRNRYMVEKCDVLLALWDGSPGGTWNCVRYAEAISKPVVNLWDDWLGLQSNSVFSGGGGLGLSTKGEDGT
jgi:uncharacterized phage-like protein YoqJ